MAGPFTARVSERIRTYERRLTATFKSSAQDSVKTMTRPMARGGRMRVDTGFLRNSLMGSTASMPRINRIARASEGETYNLDFGSIEAVILGAKLTDTLYFGFTASYAGYRERHDKFVEMAFLEWQSTVRRNAKKAMKAFP